MKRILSLILALILVVGMLPVQANADTLDNGLVYKVYGDHVEITDYTGDATNVVIPGKIKKIPVTVICNRTFDNCSSLTDIELPDSITYIGERAFAGCSGLTGIDLPDSLTYIGERAFSDCSNLVDIEIPYGVTHIGDYAFYKCSSLTGIEIPDDVTSIGDYTFANCSRLTDIEIPDGVTYIGDYAFYYCSRLTGINLPDSLTYIGWYTFYECSGLTNIVIPNSVTFIGYRAFSDCSRLTDVLISNGITSISELTFYDCSSLTRVEIPDSVTSIGDMAFSHCTSLTSIEIPDSVTSIGEGAFDFCDSLTSIEIPDSVTSIGEGAFDFCDSLTGIHVDGNNPNYSSDDRGVLFDKAKTRLIRAPGGITGTYTIPAGVSEIGYEAFRSCSGLTGVEIPNGVTEISAFAFAWCNSLTGINLPIGISCIDSSTFLACYSLPSIEIPCSVTYIGSSAFHSCNNLDNVYFTGDAPMFDKSIFYNVSATAHYPADNNTWTSDVMQSYGGYLNWTPYTVPVHIHEYTSAVHAPTCTRIGLTISTCICGDRYAADYVDPLGHNYADSICTRCGKAESDNREPSRPSDPSFGMFDAYDTLTRGMFVYALWNYFGSPDPYFINKPFVDVSRSDFYHDAVYWAVESGILSGTNPIMFSPDTYVTKAQAAAFLWAAFGSPDPAEESPPFTDVPADESYTDAIIWALEEGYMSALNDTSFGTNSLCLYTEINWISDEPEEELPDFHYLIHDDCVEIIGWGGEATELVIPDRIEGLPVTGIGEYTFFHCSSLTSIEIPDGVTYIGDSAFYCCSSLTDIDIPDGVTHIGDSAFYGCSSLTDIEIPDGVTHISDSIFYGCSSLTGIGISDGVTYIGNYAFYKCDGLTSIEIPAGVTCIGDYAFCSCSNLVSIHVDENNPNYSSDDRGVLFDKAKTLLIQAPAAITGPYTVPDSVTFIGDTAFTNCADLTGIAFPDTLITIGSCSFSNCSSLTDLEIPNDVTYICDRAFSSCSSLTSVKIPDSVTSIGDYTFYRCSSLTSIELPDGLTSIGNYAFSFCDRLTGIDIPGSVTCISDYAFSYCDGLTSVEIPGSVTYIGDFTFTWCDHLTSIYFDGDAPVFGDNVFNRVTATAYYPSGNATWTKDVMQNYGGKITWFALEPPHSHEYTAVVTAPTCTEQGYTTYTCACGESYVDDYVDALGHSYTAVVTNPTCTGQGFTTYTCLCGDSYTTDPVEALGHDMSQWETQTAPTCTEDGTESRSCFRCDCMESRTVDALGHDYTDGICGTCGEADPDYEAPVKSPFADVPAGAYYEAPVLWAVENGITSGVTADSFNPGGSCLRAQVVTFLWRAAGCPEPAITTSRFTDVKPTDFFFKPVLWAVEQKITSGVSATEFGSYANCNRAAVVTFLWRAAGSPEPSSTNNPFTDVKSTDFFYKPVLWAVENGITAGLTATTFGPTATCNRAQVVTFLYRACN